MTTIPPLAGFTVGVTAARRHEDLTALLERRGARVVHAAAMRLVRLPDEVPLRRATEACLADPPDVLVVTTGVGFRAWMETADGWGLGESLTKRLAGARILARGPKSRGALRSFGLADAWSPVSESTQELLDHLLSRELAGHRVAIQLYGQPQPEFVTALRSAGAEVIEVPVYRWALPDDHQSLLRLITQAIDRSVDALTFTSAPAVDGLLHVAAEAGLRDGLLDSLSTGVVPACVGPVTAGPLERYGVSTLRPERARLGALVRALAEHLATHRTARFTAAGHDLELRGHAALVDGQLRPLARAPVIVLRALARRPGHVLSRVELRRELGSRADPHAVEMTVARLRRALGHPDIVATVVKRGYRLATLGR